MLLCNQTPYNYYTNHVLFTQKPTKHAHHILTYQVSSYVMLSNKSHFQYIPLSLGQSLRSIWFLTRSFVYRFTAYHKLI